MKAKIALAQMQIQRDIPDNHTALREYLAEAGEAGCDFFVLPELWTCRFSPKAKDKLAEPPEGTSYRLLQEAAKNYNMYIIGGSIPTMEDGMVCNRSYVFDRGGNDLGHYDKIHMFDLVTKDGTAIRESANVRPGNDTLVLDTEFGKIGVAVCYDLRFPGLFIKMAEAGAGIIFLPSAFTHETGEKHWLALSRARAIDSQSFIVGVDAPYMEDTKVPSYGHSCIYGPFGEELFLADEKPQLAVFDIETDMIEAARAKLPVLSGQRHDIY